ncbi:SRPBCC domain-containing protein [Candidatus Roizmanbacteria bacterium]|nr:SRPBCC domain-containing protein [Candidatus Roizmanbacteria bacterium]
MKSIRQTLFFPVSPDTFYNTYLDETSHRALTGAHAHISNKTGEKYSAWDGYITGENLELVPGKKIVQSWHASTWETGRMSTITFQLKPKDAGVAVQFTHEGLADAKEVKEFSDGWEAYYWKPMKQYFEKRQKKGSDQHAGCSCESCCGTDCGCC